MLFCRLLIFKKISFSKNSFRDAIRDSNSLDQDQDQHFVVPDLGPNCKDHQQITPNRQELTLKGPAKKIN